MKIYIYIIILFALLFTSCEEWLEIQPEAQATEKEIFSTGDGYRTVLNGLYKSMGTSDLYGTELSFGMVDCMSQQYKLESMKSMSTTEKYISAGAFNYSNVYLEPAIENTWKSAFNVIANANSLIQNILTASPDLFNKGIMERNMILGEAYACRALMHFDMLRLFAPALINDDKKAYVPYVEVYPNIQASAIGVEPFLDKVIADLEHARTLVIEYDTSALGKSVSASGRSRFQNELESDMIGYKDNSIDVFFKGRGYRLSYYSITALLARVYQYAGKNEDAFKAAQEVMSFQVKGNYNIYPMFSKDNYNGILATTTFDSKKDLKVMSNLIFGVYNGNAYDENNLQFFFSKENKTFSFSWLIVNYKAQNIFYTSDGSMDEFDQDYRSSDMIFYGNGDGNLPVSAKWYLSDNEVIRDGNITIIPIIRATEMRYIMAECYARQKNFTEAQKILIEIRKNRGCSTPISIQSWNDFVKELICDARREWISEGQLFYLYKRLNANVDFGRKVIRPLKRDEYLLPVPSNQAL